MITFIKYFYLNILMLTCTSSEKENVPPMTGFYTDGLDQALDKIEIVYPERVSKDGSFVSYYLPHYYNLESLENRPKRTAQGSEDLSGDAIHFFVPIDGEKHHLELWPNLNFLAPGLVIERRDARDVENVNKAKISQISQKQCHYNGRIVGKPDSRAALSTCYGLAGYIQLPAGEEYLIEPVKDSKPAYNKEHPHIMYKRSGIKDRHGNSNCLTKGSAKDALGERLQWESIFGSQVKKDFASVNINDLMREDTVKAPKDGSDAMNNVMDTASVTSSPQENLFNAYENKLPQGNVNSLKMPQSSYPRIENDLEGNMPPSDSSPLDNAGNEKFGKYKIEFGNKLKQKPLKEELGSIKLPDINISPLKPMSNHPIEGEHIINKPGTPIFEKDKRLYETDIESRRVKRDLHLESENLDAELNNNLDAETNVDLQSPFKKCVKNEQNYKVNGEFHPELNGIKNFVKTPIEQPKLNDQDVKGDSLSEAKITQTTVERTNEDIKMRNYISDILDRAKHNYETFSNNQNNIYDQKLTIDSSNTEIKKAINNADNKVSDIAIKPSNPVNDQKLNPQFVDQIDKKYSFKNIENNVKRDIHLDTSEQSWKAGENTDKSSSGEEPEKVKHKDLDNTYSESKFQEDSPSLVQSLDSRLERNIIKENEPPSISKTQKTNTQNDEIMVSALESVVKDMDKTKVKKDVLGGFTHQPEDINPPINQPIHSKTPVKYNEAMNIKLDETPAPRDTWEKDENRIKFKDDPITGSLLIKDSGKTLEKIREPVQAIEKPSHSNVDEIIIKIKTPEGTVSEVKQNSKTETENLRKINIEPALNNDNAGSKESMFDHENNQFSTNSGYRIIDLEKSKRGIDSKYPEKDTEITVEKIKDSISYKDESDLINHKDKSLQDANVPEDTQNNNIENEGISKQKVKRDDNTIHLVIETEPEVKSSEGRNSESPAGNLFCQGRNCLEIKPIYLNDTKAAVTNGSNNNNVDNSKEKVVEKRDTDTEQYDEFCGATSTEPPLRCHDFNHKIFNLELMITVDFKVVQMHDDDDIENFILTIINMVSSNFDDKSIGLNLNVVLVRLILLTTCIKELDSDRFSPEELLENFCTWQVLVNPGRDDHPHHHDLAIFVSKMEKCEGQVMGVSYMTSVCRPDKACVICVDEGLLLANTITHQIGHSLGADHDDGQNSGCAPTLPDGTSYHMAPTITETSSAWSVCSRDAIIQFVQTQGSWCLIDFPVVRTYNFPLMLPGQIYSAAQQCKLNFHMTAIPCSVGAFCNKLYCQITDKLCATKGDPPADGTFCASNMWCFHKQCVHVGRRPGAINGEWGPWTEWSLCTRSCGGGVSSSYRICNNPKPENGGRYCIGERIRHRICQTKPCQGFTESFRDLQCKRTEDRPFRGKIFNWIQYQSLFINIECSLVCQNRRGDVVMRSPIVADGTPCKAGTRNVCIQGSCRSVGCDYVIDSNAKEDACGVCHGNGTECRIIQGVFDEAVTKKGLIEFLRIPKDSGMIFVREVAPSINTMVVSGSINRVFYLNGLGSEDSMAGDVAFGLTHGVYEKRGGMERVFIRGPTKEDLIFYILFRDINKGIHYQYATLEYDPTYVPRYQWQYLDWDPCSDPCSGGSQRARAKCVEDRGGVVDDKYCTESTRPLDIVRPCNDFPCQAKWWVSVWSDCICTGATNIMFRSVLCMRANDEGGTRVEIVKEAECSLSKKPATQKPCNYTDEENDCQKRSISDDSFFRAHRDLRRAVNPRLAFSAFSPADSEEPVAQDAQLATDQSFVDSKKESYHDAKNMKKVKAQINKNVNSKVSNNKVAKNKPDGKEPVEKKKISSVKVQETDNLKQVELPTNERSKEPKGDKQNARHGNEEVPLTDSKGRQIAKLNDKDVEPPAADLSYITSSDTSKQGGDDNDIGSKDYEGKGASENCETTGEQASSMCPTEENTSETPTTCKQTCAPQPHKKTTCCKTTPHRQYVVKTTIETTTIRPVAVKLDELNINNFALTVVPLEYSGKKKLLPQSDPEFIHLGSVGQFGVADELNATVITGQEALDLLEFARSNASEEPVILHEDMHN